MSLPNETLNAIFEDLPQSALAQVVRVCHRWRAVAERILYSTIVISESLSQRSPPYKTARCIQTILDRWHLIESVKRLHVRWQTDSPHRTAVVDRVIRDIPMVLRGSTNLESLELVFGTAGQEVTIKDLLHGCTFPSLRQLALAGLNVKGPDAIEWFLRDHPSLVHLRLCDYRHPLQLYPCDLPNLSYFRGTPQTASTILPGRPVNSLTLIGYQFVTIEDLVNMSQASVPTRHLDLSCMSVTPTLLRDISKHLIAVEFLRVKLALRHTLHFALSGISLLAGLTPVLGAFTYLLELDLSPTDSVGRAQPSEEHSLCATWARVCPSLRRVIFPSKTEWTYNAQQLWVSQALLGQF